jgi:hypothetical protein
MVDPRPDVPTLVATLERDGFLGLPGLRPAAWAEQLRQDFERLFAAARAIDGGLAYRGPARWYFPVHPEHLAGFLELFTEPRLDAVARAVLGNDYQLVEVGFDVPLPGATYQPWHRDFPIPPEALASGRFSSLAVNATCVDVRPEMGPLELVPGTQFDDGTSFIEAMRVPARLAGTYDGRAEPRRPRQGDVSIRTGQVIHRGTPNVSDAARPTLIVGLMDARYPTFGEHHLFVSAAYAATLAPAVRDHLRRARVVDVLGPIVNRYTLDVLVADEPEP